MRRLRPCAQVAQHSTAGRETLRGVRSKDSAVEGTRDGAADVDGHVLGGLDGGLAQLAQVEEDLQRRARLRLRLLLDARAQHDKCLGAHARARLLHKRPLCLDRIDAAQVDGGEELLELTQRLCRLGQIGARRGGRRRLHRRRRVGRWLGCGCIRPARTGRLRRCDALPEPLAQHERALGLTEQLAALLHALQLRYALLQPRVRLRVLGANAPHRLCERLDAFVAA